MQHEAKQKRDDLYEIACEIERCKLCQVNKIGKAVPGEGNADARVIFVGEAPGKTEAETGRPFIGRSGKLLHQMIVGAGLKEEDVFITSALKYLPEHVTPKPSEIEHGRKHLFKQIDVIQPDIIVLLGRFAALSVLDENVTMASSRGKIIKKDGRQYMIMYHPAAALYNNSLRANIEEDFLVLKKLIT